MTCITAREAAAYCQELGKRLPTSNELHFARQGAQPDFEYPWGPRYVPGSACLDQLTTGPCAVRSHPKDRTPQGVYDLVGNVSEWSTTSAPPSGDLIIVGGCFVDNLAADGVFEAVAPVDFRAQFLGFRCAASVPTATRNSSVESP